MTSLPPPPPPGPPTPGQQHDGVPPPPPVDAVRLPPPPPPAAPSAPRTARRRRRRALLVTVGVLVIALLGVGGFLLLDRGGPGLEPLAPEVDEAVEVSAQQVVVGNCIDGAGSGKSVDTVTVVPCDVQHRSEAVAGVTFDDADDYPGTRPLREQLTEVCGYDALGDTGFGEGLLDFSLWFPSKDSWDDGDPTGLCVVTTPEGTTTGASMAS